MQAKLKIVLALTGVMLCIALVASAQNLTVAGSVTAQGTGVHSFMGSVGVGTTTPTAKLQIVGAGANAETDLNVTGRIQTGDASNSGGIWLSSAGNMFVGQNGTNVGFWTGGVGWNALQVTQSGNVTIGTTTHDTPSDSLTLYAGNQNDYLRIKAPYAQQSSIAFNDDTNGQDIVTYRPASTRDYHIWTATAGDIVNVTQAGNVGIGTTAPAYKLDVNGTTRIAGIQLFQKSGNNGSVSGDTFCQGSQWGQVGSCVGQKAAGVYYPCTTVISSGGTAAVTDICAAIP